MIRSTQKLMSVLFAAMFCFGTLAGFAQTSESPNAVAVTEDVVLQWNRVLAQTLAVPGLQPATVMGSRSYSMMHLAMFDAVNSIEGTYTPYLTDVPGSRFAPTRVAAAKAAYDVLSGLYPSQQLVFDAEFAI